MYRFSYGDLADEISPLSKASVIGELAINEWNHVSKPQFILKDICIDEWQLFDYRGNRRIDQWIHQVPEKAVN